MRPMSTLLAKRMLNISFVSGWHALLRRYGAGSAYAGSRNPDLLSFEGLVSLWGMVDLKSRVPVLAPELETKP